MASRVAITGAAGYLGIDLAGVEVRALRVSYVGELGWELHVPMAGMLDVYSALVSTPHSENLVHIGSATLNAVRMEKAYRGWGADLTNEITMIEADMEEAQKDYLCLKEGFQTFNHFDT